MVVKDFSTGSKLRSPPPKRGRSARQRRVGVKAASRFDRTPQKTARARRLRRDATDVEKRLWQRLRNGQIDGLAFRRQHPLGPYILDFFCPSLRFAIELDGGQHSQSTAYNARRDEWLRLQGVTVLRFWNSDVTENVWGVLEFIAARASQLKLDNLTPTRLPRTMIRGDLPPFRGR